MSSLRERQKHQRAERILKCALRLFRKSGYAAVKMEDIAKKADVSAITVYRYFSTKQDLLLAIITNEFEAAHRQANKLLATSFENIYAAIDCLSVTNLSESESAITREMWSIAISHTIRDSESEFSAQYFVAMTRMKAQYQRLLDHAVACGALVNDTPTVALADICYANLNMSFLEFLRKNNMSPDSLHTRVASLNSKVISPFATNKSLPPLTQQ